MTHADRLREWNGIGLGLNVGRWEAWGHAMATADWWEGGEAPSAAARWRGYARAMLRVGRERRPLHMWYRHARYGRGNV